ncbi:hypothetical protein BKA82DRAFT_1004118 [Pisolithus tinctorius]|uniref:Uncharacterized protein n=1 Tax=Pisolithus tinctorius Marx 270 TaxID=870435 RepID=A0A0C3NGL4_PISTI|nr:hypothetical protein BKA82DRAFT_1004118 [Pisolithus tinctorius]KIO00195.1 hypothetical protein M404DRAFT_1004118 [Pisolithus tinctorius Marx 270]
MRNVGRRAIIKMMGREYVVAKMGSRTQRAYSSWSFQLWSTVSKTQTAPEPTLPIRLEGTYLDVFPDPIFTAASGGSHPPKLLASEPCAKGLPGCDQN